MINKIKKKYSAIHLQAKATIWFLICSVLQKGISTITTPIFTRILTSAEYGQYSIFNSWLSIVSVFVTLNLCSGVFMQGMIKHEDERGIFSSSLQGLMTTLVAIWLVVYLLFYKFWNNLFSLTTVQMLFMFVLIWTSSLFNFWSSEKRIDKKYKLLVIITIFYSIARPALGVIFVVFSDDKFTARILSMVIINLLAYTWMFFSKLHKEKNFFSKKYWKYALLFNLPLIPHYLSSTLLNSADRIMINNMISSSAAGIYSLAYSISMLMTIFNDALMKTIEPWLYQNIKTKSFDKISKITYPLLIFMAVLNLILIAFAPEIVKIFATEEYYAAIWVIPPVAMSVYFMFTYNFFASFEFYYEKKVFIMASTSIGAVVNIILNLIFIDIFGYFAAGYTTLICYILFALFHYLFMRKICKDHLNSIKIYDVKILLVISLGFMVLGFSFLPTYGNILIRYIYILILLIILLLYRKKIQVFAKTLVQIKKNKENL